MPKFGKQWLDNFIADSELQNTFLQSEVVRNLIMLQCIFYASIFNDLIIYKQAFLIQKEQSARESRGGRDDEESKGDEDRQSANQLISNSVELLNEMPPFKIGIIGCGHLGTMVLTKLLEISGSFNNLQLLVSTRQPHLLRPFQQEFGVIAEFNNERIVKECDIIFICVLPSQANEMMKDIRPFALERIDMASKNKNISKPLFISTMAAIGMNKLKLMLSSDSIFLRTKIDVNMVRDYLLKTDNQVPDKSIHPSQMLNQTDQDLAQEEKPGSAHSKASSNAQPLYGSHVVEEKGPLGKVLSQKAIKIGKETGVTAEFVVQQTGE